jgi:predicted Zn-dependent protease
MRTSAVFIVILALAGCAVNPVTGERDLILVSGQQELAMGAQNYAPMQQSQGGEYDVDPALTAYVRSVGMKVANASGVDLPYEFVVLNNSVPNAWALPGGKIAINRGLLTEMNSEAELAAVLGHEVVHAAARHSAQQQSRAILTQGVVVAKQLRRSRRRRRRNCRAADADEIRSQCRARVRQVRHALHVQGRLRPAGRGEPAGDLRAA